jgi:site-specific recombinase XerD
MKNVLSLQTENALLQKFLRSLAEGTSVVGTYLADFCHQYRDLGLGPSFINGTNSTKWLEAWQNSRTDQEPARVRAALGAARSWTGFLFNRQIIDDDAFFYLDVKRFLSGLQPTVHLEVNLQSMIRLYEKTNLAKLYKPSTIRTYVATLHDFNLFQATWPGREPGWNGLESQVLMEAWILSQIKRVDARNAGGRLGMVRELLEFVRTRHVITKNSADSLREIYPLRGWRGLISALGSAEPVQALDKLKTPERFTSHWGPSMVDWVRLKRSLGAGFEFEERTLAQLDRFLKPREEANVPVSSELLHTWLTILPGINTRTRDTKRRVAEHFFEYAIRQGHLTTNPAQFRSGEVKRKLLPFVFGQEQIGEILRRAKELGDVPFFWHRGTTYATIFAILYCLGLRVSEACRLCITDIDLEQGLVHIRQSKFYKSRVLPMGPKVQDLLAQFISLRKTLPGADALTPLFLSRHGRAVGRKTIENTLRSIIKEMGLKPRQGYRPPCLHSFRHAFALHRLIRWYQAGADVQAKLPLLSAYMGHVDIPSTQVYLEGSFALLEAANERFEARFGWATLEEGGLV